MSDLTEGKARQILAEMARDELLEAKDSEIERLTAALERIRGSGTITWFHAQIIDKALNGDSSEAEG